MTSDRLPTADGSGAVNTLAQATSPYLRQHADNPVAWSPWGDEAFARAAREDKPVFCSVGYSTCHWCHVMAHESFEDPAVAAVLNRACVPVKVDREQRPDVDAVYMAYCQATTGHGGWPLNVWLTPARDPFFARTYVPPDDLIAILTALDRAWRDQRDDVVRAATRVVAALRVHNRGETADGPPAAATVPAAVAAILDEEDTVHGGFGQGPKFPRPVLCELLLDHHQRRGDGRALTAVQRTLAAIAGGGIHDHLGGGFHRYTVDTAWRLPHFEKMLYDQAQLIRVYSRLHAVAPDARWRDAVTRAVGYLDERLSHPEGPFYAAEDADSRPAPGQEPREGWCYTWSADEIAAVLDPATADLVARRYGVRTAGNVDPALDQRGELSGRNVLACAATVADLAADVGRPVAAVAADLATARTRLHAARAHRPPPHRDEKVILAWNALTVSALATAATVFARQDWLDRARRAASWLQHTMVDPTDGRLWRAWCAGVGTGPGQASDYACMSEAALDLHQADGDAAWLSWAIGLQRRLDRDYADPAGGWFDTPAGDDLPFRPKEDFDGAEPAASSVAVTNALRLWHLTGSIAWQDAAHAALAAGAARLRRAPVAVPALLRALDLAHHPPRRVVLACATAEAGRELAAVVRAHPTPHQLLVVLDPAARAVLAPMAAAYAAMQPGPTGARAYVCIGQRCLPSVDDPAELARILAEPLTSR